MGTYAVLEKCVCNTFVKFLLFVHFFYERCDFIRSQFFN